MFVVLLVYEAERFCALRQKFRLDLTAGCLARVFELQIHVQFLILEVWRFRSLIVTCIGLLWTCKLVPLALAHSTVFALCTLASRPCKSAGFLH